MHLVKRRYLLIEIAGSEAINKQTFMDAVWDAILQLFGEYGASQANLVLIRHNLKPNHAILRCSHKTLNMVRASLASIMQIHSKPVAFRVLGVSGTLRALQKQMISTQP